MPIMTTELLGLNGNIHGGAQLLGGLGAYTPGSCACDPSLTGSAWDACVAALNADTTCGYQTGATTLPTTASSTLGPGAATAASSGWYTTWWGITGILVVGAVVSYFLFGGDTEHEGDYMLHGD
jgi:hypothetical protein